MTPSEVVTISTDVKASAVVKQKPRIHTHTSYYKEERMKKEHQKIGTMHVIGTIRR